MIINIFDEENIEKINTDDLHDSKYGGVVSKVKKANISKKTVNVALPFADIHTHGAVGYDFSDASLDEMKAVDKFYLENGIGYSLPTLVALSRENYKKQISSVIKIMKGKNTSFIGINLEGPFINPKKKGAINEKDIRPVDLSLAKELWEISEGNIKLMTVAPELENFEELADFAEGKFTISLGHTAADYETAAKALDHTNARHITHIFNAMNSLHHRTLSLVGAALEQNCIKEAICDGFHLKDGIIKMLFNRMSDEIVIISDSVSACGLDDGVYKLGGLEVFVKDGRATLLDGTIAGSCYSICKQVAYCKTIGLDISKILYSSTFLPLKSLNIPYKSIETAEKFNILDENLNLIGKIGY